MMLISLLITAMASGLTLSSASDPGRHLLSPLEWAGGNSPFFVGPNVNNIQNAMPDGCVVDLAAFVSRHGARFPDPSSFQGWLDLSTKIHNSSFKVSPRAPELQFIQTWEPVVKNPTQDVAMLNLVGYKELYDMGVDYRIRYPDFYTSNTPFILWSNFFPQSPRVIDSARLFARGYLGPNATILGSIFVLNSTDPLSIANSLGPSDACPTFVDNSGGSNATTWNNIYLPPITKRINSLLKGNLTFTDADIQVFPVLCNFESAITGKRSPWCGVLEDKELRENEYAQDLRYYYGSGPGSFKNGTMMLPVLNAIVKRFQDGPNRTYTSSDGTTFTPPPLTAMFANDGQINELVSEIGVFDEESSLPSTHIPAGQRYIASHFVTMRGTVNFERLTCSNENFVRIMLNGAVYPIPSCRSGPGSSCPLDDYATLIARKNSEAGSLVDICNIKTIHPTLSEKTNTATFLFDLALPFAHVVKP